MATDGIVPPASASGGGSATHPSVDELADLHAGALDDERARQIMPHVRRCAECTAVLDALSAVQAELRALPTPTMPASVAARLDAALAAERGADSAPVPPPPTSSPHDSADSGATTQLPTNAEPPSRGPVVDLDRERMRRRRRARLIGVAAAGVVLVGGGVIVGSQLTESDSGKIQAEQPSVTESAEQSAENSGGEGPIGGPPQANRYEDQDSLQSGISEVLQKGELDHEDQASDPDVAGDMAIPANRLRCLQALPDRPQGANLAVQFVEYQGEPAYVFVFAIPNNDDEVRVVVVPEECGTEPVDPIASFLAPR